MSTTWHGREKLHYLNPVPIRELADRWIRQCEHDRLDVLTDLKHTLRPLPEPAGASCPSHAAAVASR